jgi:hypothetical protein
MTSQHIELSPRSDGARYRRVRLVVERDGTITLHAHEMGAGSGAEWGVDDEEITLSVPPDQVARLALALGAEILKGGDRALSKLADICEANDVAFRVACWT